MIVDNKTGYGYCRDNPIKVGDYESLKDYVTSLDYKNDKYRIYAKENNHFVYQIKEKRLYITYYIYVKVNSDPVVLKRYQLYFVLFNKTSDTIAPEGFILGKVHSFYD